MSSIASRIAIAPGDGLLRLALKADALITGANGAAYLILADALDSPLGVPATFLRPVGAFLLVFAALVWVVGTRETIKPAAAWSVVDANALWVVASVVMLATGAHDPTTGGAVWIALQALVVGAFAALQATATRRAAAV